MAILDVLVYPNPALREPVAEVTEFDENLKRLVSDMWETMYLSKGVGLAAPQVGVGKRLFVVDWEENKRVVVNPEIVEAEGTETGDEGCLSFPGIYEEVTRPGRIRILYMDENGERHDEVAEGYLARVYSHETDHLDGKLLIDHLSALKRAFLRKKMSRRPRAKE
ncbi:MAG: peptide deformylase [Synergistaceae bacterium]|jgi:peptide deformylase|nr:peptide deformylase [Synergistaceae bacterium]